MRSAYPPYKAFTTPSDKEGLEDVIDVGTYPLVHADASANIAVLDVALAAISLCTASTASGAFSP